MALEQEVRAYILTHKHRARGAQGEEIEIYWEWYRLLKSEIPPAVTPPSTRPHLLKQRTNQTNTGMEPMGVILLQTTTPTFSGFCFYHLKTYCKQNLSRKLIKH